MSDSLDGHPFETDIPKDLPLFRADSALMEQVIANLLLNSALHTPAGDRRSSSRPAWTERSHGSSSPWRTAGRGCRRRCASASSRNSSAGDAAKAGGLGLGLSIIRGFVTAQGGDVVAGENPGGGAVLTVYLPFKEHGDVPAE